MSAVNHHHHQPQMESAVHVFYVKGLTKILQHTTSKNKELKDKCNEILAELKKLEKEKVNIQAELSINPNKFFRPLELACASKKPQIMEIALDCLQKLMMYKLIGETTKYAKDPNALLVDVIVATICNCFEPNQDDNVQLQIMKALLTAVTSCDIKGKSVRATIKTSFNIHLVSKSAINQKTAKATLTQMLNVIFQRMETNKKPDSQTLHYPSAEGDEDDMGMGISSPELQHQQHQAAPLAPRTPNSPTGDKDLPSELFVATFVKGVLDQVCAANDPDRKSVV